MLLLVGLPASPADHAARLGGGRSLATVGLLHNDHFMEDGCFDLHPEDLGTEFGCPYLPPVQVDDVDRGHGSTTPLGGLLRLLNGNQAATGAWDGSSHEEEVLLRPYVDDLECLGGDPHDVHQFAFGKHAHRDGRADLRLSRGTKFAHMPVRG